MADPFYVPILRWKRGEQVALRYLSGGWRLRADVFCRHVGVPRSGQVAQTAGFAVCGSPLTTGIRWHEMTPGMEGARTRKAGRSALPASGRTGLQNYRLHGP